MPNTKPNKSFLVSKEIPPEHVNDMELRFSLKEIPNLSVGKDDILSHRAIENSGTGQIVIPRNLTSRVIQMMQDDLGNFGTAKTTARVKEEFFWPSTSSEIVLAIPS